jgi:hypothetical protein
LIGVGGGEGVGKGVKVGKTVGCWKGAGVLFGSVVGKTAAPSIVSVAVRVGVGVASSFEMIMFVTKYSS